MVSFPEAWEHFYTWMQNRRNNGEIQAIPKDVQEAQYAYTGRRANPLGNKRIRSLIEKYGEGRYQIREGVILPE